MDARNNFKTMFTIGDIYYQVNSSEHLFIGQPFYSIKLSIGCELICNYQFDLQYQLWGVMMVVTIRVHKIPLLDLTC